MLEPSDFMSFVMLSYSDAFLTLTQLTMKINMSMVKALLMNINCHTKVAW